MYKVLIASKLNPQLRTRLEECGLTVEEAPGIGREELLAKIANYDVVVVRSKPVIDKEILEQGAKGRLKLVVRAGVGLDNIDLETARRLGVRVENVPEASTQSVAELALAHILALARRIHIHKQLVQQGMWKKENGLELHGKTLVIIGFGRIGEKLAQLGRALGMKVIAHDLPELKEKALKLRVEFEEDLCKALSQADIISIHVPLTPGTRHLINKSNINCIKPGAILVNTSRGQVVETEALLEALEKGILGAVGLDVLEHEPPRTEAERKLAEHPDVLITPHIGASTHEAQERIALLTAEKIIANLQASCTPKARQQKAASITAST